MSNLKLSLLQNAEDFILSAIEYSKNENKGTWKYSLLHLASAIELIIKANLEQEHWSLLFENVNNAERESLEKGRFKSVDFETAVKRLERIAGLTISDKDEKYLRKIRDIRNRLTHFAIDIKVEELKSVIAQGINIFMKFYEALDVNKSRKEFIFMMSLELREFQKFVDLRMRELKNQLDNAQRPPNEFGICLRCLRDALILEEHSECAICLFCGIESTFQELADNSEGPGGPCPECEIGVLGFIAYSNEDGEFMCTKCGFSSDYNYNKECLRCENVFWSNKGESFCSDCLIAFQDAE